MLPAFNKYLVGTIKNSRSYLLHVLRVLKMKLCLQDTQELNEYRIDLAETLKAPYKSYMFRLLFALNDLLSVHYLHSCFERFESPINIQNGMESYLVRVMQCHTVEAYIAFIERIQPYKKSPVIFPLFHGH